MSLMALLSLALMFLFTLTSYFPQCLLFLDLLSLALLSQFTLTSYVPHSPSVLGATVPVPTVTIHPNYLFLSWPYCPWPYCSYSP